MSSTLNPAIVPERDNLPLKKREQRGNSLPSTTQQQQYDTATFKAPYPYKSNNEARVKHTGPLQPVPKRVPALYQPWMHTYTSTRSKPQVLSAFREHHSWAAWRESYPLHLGSDLSHPFQHHWPATNALYYPSKFSPISPVDDGFQRTGGGYNWEQQLNKLRDKNSNTLWQSNERNRGPYVKRKERNVESFPNIKANCPSCPPHSQHEDPNNALCKPTTLVKRPISGHSCFREEKSCNTYTSISEDPSRSSPRASFENATVSAWSKKRRPWLLPHFVAGSLIELRDGRLRRVEHLQTEDFLLGSLACPDLRLSCCTVQSIAPSASSSSISRLLILLHDHQSQELVDVYVEYPFFVRGRGWSSCSPQKTAHLCGLQCHQLSVGDVCLALTPISAPQQPPSATSEPETSPTTTERDWESLKMLQPLVPPGPSRPAEGPSKQAEVVRRRHQSAPELRGPGINCM